MNQYKIQKNIPVPEARGKWAWILELEVGDSVIVATDEIAIARARAWQLSKNNNRKFCARSIGDGEHRLWRIA